MRWRLALLAILLGLFTSSAVGHEAKDPGSIGLTERLGQSIPAGVRCVDEQGKGIPLQALVDRPTILSLVYYSCSHMCPQLLGGLTQLVSELDLDPRKDYRLITVSFDGSDTPQDAAVAKRNFTKPLDPGYPREAWAFLTAEAHEITKLTQALGFSFRKDGHGFTHPVILVMLAPGGRISGYVYASRYHYGAGYPIMFSPMEFKESLEAAARGRIQVEVTRPLLFCFPHEPMGQQRFFKLLGLLGLGTLFSMALLFIYLLAGRKENQGRMEG